VQINTGEIGVVIEARQQFPLKLQIRIILDAKGHAVDKVYEMNLKDTPTQFIIKVFRKEERIIFPSLEK